MGLTMVLEGLLECHSKLCMTWCADKPSWAVVMSRGSKYTKQVVEMDFQYPSEGIHYHWDQGKYLLHATRHDKEPPGSPVYLSR